MTYVPKPDEDRVQRGPKYRGERGVWVGTHWFPDLDLLPDDQRQMPDTRSDEEAREHRWWCECVVCTRPEAQRFKKLGEQDRRRQIRMASSALSSSTRSS